MKRMPIQPIGAGLVILVALAAHSSGGNAASTAHARSERPAGTIVFSSERSGNQELYSVRADGARLGQLTRNRVPDTSPVFSPDGRRILFRRETPATGTGLWVMNADASGQRRIASWASNAAWSPDSRHLAYIGLGNSQANASPLVIAGLDGRRRVLRGRFGSPSWSPDGRLIAVTREIHFVPALSVVGSDGRGLRILRRNVFTVLGWSPSGEITFAAAGGVLTLRPDGRGRRRVLPGFSQSFAWSPDGRRFVYVDGRNRLRLGSAGSRRSDDLTPRGAGRMSAPAWSPDGRWIAVESEPTGASHADLALVAADGSGWRRLTHRVPLPFGSENRQPDWRSRGATAARLGRRPVAPLPSETISPTRFRLSGPIRALAADGRVAAVIVGFGEYCSGVEAWIATTRRVIRPQKPCPYGADYLEGTPGVAVAGTRVAWVHTSGGNSLSMDELTATFGRPRPVTLADEGSAGAAGTWARDPVGDGSLLAFTDDRTCDEYGTENGDPEDQCPPGRTSGGVVAATIWRVGGSDPCPDPTSVKCTRVATAKGELTALAADAGRLAVRTDTGLSILGVDGTALRTFPVRPVAAFLSGVRLAVRTADSIEVFDIGSGALIARLAVRRAVTLGDLEGDLLVTAEGKTVTVLRLSDRKTASFRTAGPAHAQLEPPGLFLAGGRLLTFVPMAAVVRRLGG